MPNANKSETKTNTTQQKTEHRNNIEKIKKENTKALLVNQIMDLAAGRIEWLKCKNEKEKKKKDESASR